MPQYTKCSKVVLATYHNTIIAKPVRYDNGGYRHSCRCKKYEEHSREDDTSREHACIVVPNTRRHERKASTHGRRMGVSSSFFVGLAVVRSDFSWLSVDVLVVKLGDVLCPQSRFARIGGGSYISCRALEECFNHSAPIDSSY